MSTRKNGCSNNFKYLYRMAVRYYSEGCGFLPKGRTKITAWIRETIASEGFRTGDVSYIFCSPDFHMEMNRNYLGHDYHTDVITFDYSDPENKKTVSGDIFIDPWTVMAQAAEWDSTPGEELMRVMLHGVLHLCGHGDKTSAEEKKMRSLEDKYLAEYRRNHGAYPPFTL